MGRSRTAVIAIIAACIGLGLVAAPRSSGEEADIDLNNGLVGWWDGDVVSGTTAYDLAGDVDGTLVGGVGTVAGPVGNAFTFDGVDDRIEFGDEIDFTGASKGAVAAWIRTDGSDEYYNCIFEYDCHWGGSYAIQLDLMGGGTHEGKIGFYLCYFWANSGTYYYIFSDTDVRDGEWHHVVGQWDSSGMKLYLDGVLEASNTQKVTLNNVRGYSRAGGIYYWASGYSSFWDGEIDELRLYSRALSYDEVQALHAEGMPDLEGLADYVDDLDIDSGTKTSLLAKLSAAEASLEKDNVNAALGSLNAFLNAVAAQKGKHIPDDAAVKLTAMAEWIVDGLEE